MVDSARVHPEPEPQQRGLAKRIVSSFGRTVEQLSRLYGYALLVSGIDVVLLGGVSALPLTKWDDAGVPRANTVVLASAIDVWAAGALNSVVAFHVAAVEPFPDPARPHVCEKYAWSGYFVGNTAANAVLSACLVYTPLALGANPRYYLLLVGRVLGGVVLGHLVGDFLARRQCADDNIGMAETQVALEVDTSPPRPMQGDGGGFYNGLVWLRNQLLLFGGAATYILLVIPYYLAETTSECVNVVLARSHVTHHSLNRKCHGVPHPSGSWTRFIIVCCVHPIVQELLMTYQRQPREKYFKFIGDPDRQHFALRSIFFPSLFEEVMVLNRRFMLGAMRDPTTTLFAVVVTGLEEAVLRCTMATRDKLWDWFVDNEEPTGARLAWRQCVQAASAANAMRVEITSIIVSRWVTVER